MNYIIAALFPRASPYLPRNSYAERKDSQSRYETSSVNPLVLPIISIPSLSIELFITLSYYKFFSTMLPSPLIPGKLFIFHISP